MEFYLLDQAIPTGAKLYDGKSSLSSFLSGLPAGSTGVLDYDFERKENVSASIKDGVTILPGRGKRPWVRGYVHLSFGTVKLSKFYGLSILYPETAPDGHILDIKHGTFEWGYSEVKDAPCYTLVHPTGDIKNWRMHNMWVHNNAGVIGHDGNQDHGFYISARVEAQNGRVDHNLIEGMPRGRNIKLGGASSGNIIGGVLIDFNTMDYGRGPSNGQVSNGATNTHWNNNVLTRSGKSTSLTDGSGSKSGNTYAGNWSDKTTGPNSTNFKDALGNVVKPLATLQGYAANGLAGKGHLAANA